MADHALSRTLSCEDAEMVNRLERLEKGLVRRSSLALGQKQGAVKEWAGGGVEVGKRGGGVEGGGGKNGAWTFWRRFGCGRLRKKEWA